MTTVVPSSTCENLMSSCSSERFGLSRSDACLRMKLAALAYLSESATNSSSNCLRSSSALRWRSCSSAICRCRSSSMRRCSSSIRRFSSASWAAFIWRWRSSSSRLRCSSSSCRRFRAAFSSSAALFCLAPTSDNCFSAVAISLKVMKFFMPTMPTWIFDKSRELPVDGLIKLAELSMSKMIRRPLYITSWCPS